MDKFNRAGSLAETHIATRNDEYRYTACTIRPFRVVINMTTTKQTVCVVVPVYRAELTVAERAALERCMSILGGNPVVIAKPQHLDISILIAQYPQVIVESFREEYFSGIDGYNRMMLSDEFYARFANYEFILVHQLDAFVFNDQLLEWCSRGYDYIGAPWLPNAKTPHLLRQLHAAIRRRLYRLVDRQKRNRGVAHYAQLHYSAGNGGFSLRRVEKMREVLARLHAKADLYRSGKRRPWAEDVFFCVEANRFQNLIKLPGLREAARFAWETYPTAAAHLTRGALPFGCHGWPNQKHRDDWQPIFEKLGYSLHELVTKD